MEITNITDFVNTYQEEIIKGINFSWTDLQKIRYVYLKLASYFEKNTDFFLNDKLHEFKMEKSELTDIYFNSKVFIRKDNDNNLHYQIICKSIAECLKEILKNIGIQSTIVHTTGDVENDLLHWFLVVKYDNDKQIFLTLAADLPFIKNNFPTEHFGSNINRYQNGLNNTNYDLPDDENIIIETIDVYDDEGNYLGEGKEIKHEILHPTSMDKFPVYQEKIKKFKELDESIGYGKLYENQELVTPFNYKRMYIDILEGESKIYDIFLSSFKLKENYYYLEIDDITEEMINNFKENLNKYICEYLNNKLNLNYVFSNYLDYESIYNNYLNYILNINTDTIASKTLIDYKKEVNKEKDNKELGLIKAVISILKTFDNYIITKRKYDELNLKLASIVNEYNQNGEDDLYQDYRVLAKEIVDTNNDLLKLKKNLYITKINNVLNHIANYVVKNEYNDEYIPQSYIIKKFTTLIPKIFDMDYIESMNKRNTNFSLQGYSEQKTVIDIIIKKVFDDLTIKNCKQIPDYNTDLDAVKNRMRIFPLKDTDTGEYCIGFRIYGNIEKNEDEKEFIYIPSINLLRLRNPLKDQKYIYVSNSLNNYLDKIEDIEDINEKQK